MSLLLSGCGKLVDFETAAGDPVALTQFYGRPVLVSYYAPWCAPCQRELPLLQQMVRQDGVQVLLVSYDPLSSSEHAKLQATLDPDLPLLRTSDRARLPFPRPDALPTSYLLDASGKLTRTLRGELSAPQTAELVAEMKKPLPKPQPWVLFTSANN